MLKVVVKLPRYQLKIIENRDKEATVILLEKLVRSSIGSQSEIIFSENTEENEVFVEGTICPECDAETEIKDEKYLNLLKDVGREINREFPSMLRLKVVTKVCFAGQK